MCVSKVKVEANVIGKQFVEFRTEFDYLQYRTGLAILVSNSKQVLLKVEIHGCRYEFFVAGFLLKFTWMGAAFFA